MKKITGIIIIAFAGLFITSCNADDKKTEERVDKKNEITVTEVPMQVKDSFTATHSSATDIAWEEAHEGDVKTFKVKFKLNDKAMKAEYKGDGALIKESEDN